MSVAHAINYVLFTMKKERLKREHRASLSTISSAVLQLMNTQEQMATASRQNTNMYDSGTEEDWGIGAGVRRRRLPHSMSSRARSPFSASYGDEASFTQDSPRATGRSAYTLTSAPAPLRQQLDAEETEIVYMESSMPPEPSSTTVTPRPGDVHPTPRRSSSFREGGSATRLPPIRTTVVSPTRQASSFRGRIDRVVPVQDVEGGAPAFNPLAEPSPVELSQLAPSPPVAQLPANPSAAPLAVNVPEPAAKQADGAPAPGIPAAQRQALKAAALKARRNAPSDARSRRGGWAACRPLKMCMNAWYKADASRKIDVVITLACALAYILGVFVIFAPPSDVTIDE
ncbi:MAG: hypothetical protein EOO41_03440 [Methanobacteriota archaeon]|nr:MAG: hypothetical protein EOO41_03440 [Euryarchaeota archaeon]